MHATRMSRTTARRAVRCTSVVRCDSEAEAGRVAYRFANLGYLTSRPLTRDACMRSGLVLAFPLVMASLSAQAPVITPAGDPSVKNDTIYKLAVKPEDYPDQSYVFLLDD